MDPDDRAPSVVPVFIISPLRHHQTYSFKNALEKQNVIVQVSSKLTELKAELQFTKALECQAGKLIQNLFRPTHPLRNEDSKGHISEATRGTIPHHTIRLESHQHISRPGQDELWLWYLPGSIRINNNNKKNNIFLVKVLSIEIPRYS